MCFCDSEMRVNTLPTVDLRRPNMEMCVWQLVRLDSARGQGVCNNGNAYWACLQRRGSGRRDKEWCTIWARPHLGGHGSGSHESHPAARIEKLNSALPRRT